jgi:hypothetical protein
MRLNGFSVGTAKDVDFFNAIHSEPFEGVVEHWDVDEGEEDFGGFSTDRAETLQKEWTGKRLC